ncbi:MAG: hypothetical protein QXU32_01870 [Nitrososphaerales archaeon]
MIHVAKIGLMQVDVSTGNVINKDASAIKDFRTQLQPVTTRPREWTIEHRVIEDPTIPNTTGNPTIKAYLEAEDAAGLKLVYMDQYTIITQN